MTSTIPASRNTEWGFFGTLARRADAQQAWPLAMAAIARATGGSAEAVRDFLDSAHGRHLADDVANELHAGRGLAAAIAAAVARWMAWRIGRDSERRLGIPRGLPYLTGLVAHIEIAADAA